MLSFEFYKVIHLACLLVVIFTLSLGFFGKEKRKWIRITSMTASFLMMVAGMGLLAKTKMGWPLWVQVKLGLWCILAILAPVLTKRLPDNKKTMGATIVGLLFFIAIIMVTYRPL